nr:hypothetical protein BCU38_06140 [Vibrio splendidus]
MIKGKWTVNSSRLAFIAIISLFLSACMTTGKPASQHDEESINLPHGDSNTFAGSSFDVQIMDGKIEGVDSDIIDVAYIEVRDRPGHIKKITLTNSLLFDFAQHNIKPEVKQQITSVSKAIHEHYSQEYIYVVGHTDSVGKQSLNSRLSAKRATSVVQVIGQSSYKVDHNKIEIVPAGEFFPLVPNDTKSNRALNRRVEIFISPSRELALDYFKRYGCPQETCQSRNLQAIKVSRGFQMESSERGNLGTKIRLNSESSQTRNASTVGIQLDAIINGTSRGVGVNAHTRPTTVNTTIRPKPAIPTIVRNTELAVERRTIKLSSSYDVDPKDTKRNLLSKQL